MPVRLVTVDEVDRWRTETSTALAAAEKAMKARMLPVLRANGLTWSSPVADAADLWSQDDWVRVVAAHVEPEARRIALDVLATIKGRVQPTVAWGMADPVDQLTAMIVDKLLTAGPKLGRELAVAAAGADPKAIKRALDDASAAANPLPRYRGVQHPNATPTILDEYQARFAELDRVAARVGGHLSDAASALLASTAADQGPGVQYVWNCSFENSRPDHMDADGQTVPAGEPFDVGGEGLQYPGDPDGSDANVDNCLCWLEVEGVDLDRDFEASLAADVE